MPNSVVFEIRGAKELEQTLRELGPQISVRLGDKGLKAGARVIVKEAKRLAPRKTGRLRRSITAVKGLSKTDERVVRIGLKPPGRRYGHLVEFGTRRAPAHPYLRPALDGKAQEALKAMVEAMADGILKQEWKRTLEFLAEGGELDFGALGGE